MDLNLIFNSFRTLIIETPQLNLFRNNLLVGEITIDDEKQPNSGQILIESQNAWRLMFIIPKILNKNSHIRLTKNGESVWMYFENLSPPIDQVEKKYPDE